MATEYYIVDNPDQLVSKKLYDVYPGEKYIIVREGPLPNIEQSAQVSDTTDAQ